MQNETKQQLSNKINSYKELIVVKLGGSVITNKDKPMTPDLAAINRLTKEISDVTNEQLIIVHGGGSFGHPLAKQYNIKDGYREASQIQGFTKTHQAMTALNRLVVDALIQKNVVAFPISPSSCIITKNGRIQTFCDSAIVYLLKNNYVPVLFGDVVLDTSIGFTILSGDQLVVSLANKFNAKKIIFGVDVDGLFTADPKTNEGAQLIQSITFNKLGLLINQIEKTKTDVTGGMFGKIFELTLGSNTETTTLIINAAKEGNIRKALKEEWVAGTMIKNE
ncbi:MAG: isopentenyl phosphate kinase [Candidatus Bathyarchaeota archaeon]